MTLQYTLITDGSSDKTLLPILDWLCREHYSGPIEGNWFDPRPFAPPRLSLKDRILKGLQLYPCKLLFIHRDAEGENPQKRNAEISEAFASINCSDNDPPFLCVIPVRMTEAWLLSNEKAIRHAAGNPNGTMDLDIPKITTVEKMPDVKNRLFEILKNASGLNSRRRRRLNVLQLRIRIAELTNDFSPLRSLSTFSQLENDIKVFVSENRIYLDPPTESIA